MSNQIYTNFIDFSALNVKAHIYSELNGGGGLPCNMGTNYQSVRRFDTHVHVDNDTFKTFVTDPCISTLHPAYLSI